MWDSIRRGGFTMQDTNANSVGVIGIGLVGSAVLRMTGASRGWDINPAKCVNAHSATDVAEASDYIFMCLPNSECVQAVLANMELRPGLIVIDTSTGDPRHVVAIGQELSSRGVHYLDACISGSSAQIQNRDVLVMVGGDLAIFHQCSDLLACFAKDIVHVGPCGQGTKMKLVTNLVLGLNRVALAEGLAFAQQLELDGNQTLDILQRSMAGSKIMATKGIKMIEHDFTPQAKLSQHLKDVQLMLDATTMPLPMTETHRGLLSKAVELGYGDLDNSAIIKAIIEP